MVAPQMPNPQNPVEMMKALSVFLSDKDTYAFVEVCAELAAHYYLTLIREGVPTEAAAQMAANYKPMPNE